MGLTNACWSSPFFLFFVDDHFNLISQYSFSKVVLAFSQLLVLKIFLNKQLHCPAYSPLLP